MVLHANRDLALDFLHNLLLGLIKRLTVTTFTLAGTGRQGADAIVVAINKFDFFAAGFSFRQSGLRVVKLVKKKSSNMDLLGNGFACTDPGHIRYVISM